MHAFVLAVLMAVAVPWTAARAQDAVSGEAVFKRQCSICHSAVDGMNMVGPSLFGIVGRRAGTAAGFPYSAANKDSLIIWDAVTLDPYLTNPRAALPGTKMAFPGLKDPRERAGVIAYLQTLR